MSQDFQTEQHDSHQPARMDGRELSILNRSLRDDGSRLKDRPFLDDSLMDDSLPAPTWENLSHARLRRCPFDLECITWEAKLGGGFDGFVWLVKFDGNGPFALKLLSLPAYIWNDTDLVSIVLGSGTV